MERELWDSTEYLGSTNIRTLDSAPLNQFELNDDGVNSKS